MLNNKTKEKIIGKKPKMKHKKNLKKIEKCSKINIFEDDEKIKDMKRNNHSLNPITH